MGTKRAVKGVEQSYSGNQPGFWFLIPRVTLEINMGKLLRCFVLSPCRHVAVHHSNIKLQASPVSNLGMVHGAGGQGRSPAMQTGGKCFMPQ